MAPVFILYKTTRTDGKFYIGVHSTCDLNDNYLGSGHRLKASVKKHGRQAHMREVLQVFNTREEAYAEEKLLVTEELLKDPNCLNLVPGGRGGFKPTEEVRLKLSSASKNRSVEYLDRWRAKNVGRKRPIETGQKISKSLKEHKRTPEHCANNGKAVSKPCTIDGINIYPSMTAMVKALGWSKFGGAKSPSFQYV